MIRNNEPFRKGFLALCLFLAAWLLLAGCAARQLSTVCAGDVENNSGAVIRDLRITHMPTGRFFAVGSLQPGKSFFLDFQTRELEATSADLTWTDSSGRPHRDRLDLRLLMGAHPGGPYRMVYSIWSDGLASVNLRACGPRFGVH